MNGKKPGITVEGLRGMREVAGKTQVEVAAKMGVTQQVVQRMEQSWPNVQMRTLFAYAAACGGLVRVCVEFEAGGQTETAEVAWPHPGE